MSNHFFAYVFRRLQNKTGLGRSSVRSKGQQKFPLALTASSLILGLAAGAALGLASAPAKPTPSSPVIPSEEITVRLYCPNTNATLSLDLETYVAGVVAGEMPASFEPEALKAQAVAARTYAYSKTKAFQSTGAGPDDHPSAPLCNTTHCQVYSTEEQLRSVKSQEWMEQSWPKILSAVKETAGQIMYYQGEPVSQPLFHSASGGQTENSEDVFVTAVPYLRSVSSEYESAAPHENESVTFSFSELTSRLSQKRSCGTLDKNSIRILSRSEGGRVLTFRAGDSEFTGREIRDLLGLRSANFSLSFQDSSVTFTTKGYGHGVGMSQWGANGMAQEGADYISILTHYYNGVTVSVF